MSVIAYVDHGMRFHAYFASYFITWMHGAPFRICCMLINGMRLHTYFKNVDSWDSVKEVNCVYVFLSFRAAKVV